MTAELRVSRAAFYRWRRQGAGPAVVRLPGGGVLLPGLDTAMDDAVWAELSDGHPQAGLKHLLTGMGAVRGDVQAWAMPMPWHRAG